MAPGRITWRSLPLPRPLWGRPSALLFEGSEPHLALLLWSRVEGPGSGFLPSLPPRLQEGGHYCQCGGRNSNSLALGEAPPQATLGGGGRLQLPATSLSGCI